VLSTDLAKMDFLSVPAQHSAAGVERKIGVGPLVLVHTIGLQAGYDRWTPVHATLIERSEYLVSVLEKAMPEIKRGGVRVGCEVRRRPLVHPSVHRRDDGTDRAAALPKILCRARDREIRERIVRRVAGTRGSLRRRVQHAHRQTAGEPTEQFCRADYRRRLERDSVAVDSGELGSSSDAPTIV